VTLSHDTRDDPRIADAAARFLLAQEGPREFRARAALSDTDRLVLKKLCKGSETDLLELWRLGIRRGTSRALRTASECIYMAPIWAGLKDKPRTLGELLRQISVPSLIGIAARLRTPTLTAGRAAAVVEALACLGCRLTVAVTIQEPEGGS